MSLETVIADIREQAESEAAAIREQAEQDAQELIDEAEQDADEIVATAEAEAREQIEREREQERSNAALQAKQERLAARRSQLEDVHDRLEEEIAELEGDRRETLTRTLLEAGLEEFDEDATVQVHGASADEELIEELCADYDRAIPGDSRDCLGGVLLESESARVRVNNTFDAILESVWEDRLKDISDILFEE